MKATQIRSVCFALPSVFVPGLISMLAALALSACTVDAGPAPSPFLSAPSTASAAKAMDIEGTWQSTCYYQSGNYVREIITAKDNRFDVEVRLYTGSGCPGFAFYSTTVKGEMAYVGRSFYVIDGHDVDMTLTQPDGTVKRQPTVILLDRGFMYLSNPKDTTPGQRPNHVNYGRSYIRTNG